MSYWVSLEMDTGGDEFATVDEEPGNMTSNVSSMWFKALGHSLRDLNGRQARDCIVPLSEAVERMLRYDWDYKQLNPENGWGNYEGAMDYLDRLRRACVRHPRARIRVSS